MLKYKAWLKEEMVMVTVSSIFPPKYISVSPECGVIQGKNGNYIRTIYPYDEVCLLPYLNINDVNGRELYLGDRVMCQGEEYAIMWNDTFMRMELVNEFKRVPLYNKMALTYVGNIYEVEE
jgi:hypothetical protein